MKTKNAFVLAGLLAACSASAQTPTNAPAQPAPPAMANPGAPGAPRFSPAMRTLPSIRNSILMLDRSIADLQRSDNDYGGHRQSAIDACQKAKDELTEIAKQAGIPLGQMRGPGMQRPGFAPPGPNGQPAPGAQTTPPPPPAGAPPQ